MKNPFRSESEAYRFLLATVGYFAAIVLASLAGGKWWGVGVAALLTLAAVFWFFRREPADAPLPRTAPRRASAEGDKLILVVANETLAGRTLRDLIRERAEGVNEQVLVVSPALNSPLRHWTSDEDPARAEAQKRLEESVAALRAAGVNVRGEVGDGEPLQAMEDALRTFGADEIIVSTHPEGRSHWLERGVVSAARERFAVPITHVVVDLDAEPEETG